MNKPETLSAERGADSGAAPCYAPIREIELRDREQGGVRIIARDERKRCKRCEGNGSLAILCGCDSTGIQFGSVKCHTCDGTGYVAHNGAGELPGAKT